jgi:hypothetical protein
MLMTVKELVQLLTPFLVLAATWLIGQRILTGWDLRKKRQELDIAVASQFQQLYGEAKEVGRLWREVTRQHDQHSQPISVPSDIRWQLFSRAAAVEGKFEAVVIKLVTERPLKEEQVQSIGLFRQGCQELRESIREDRSLAAMRYGGGYTLFNNLAAEITCLLAQNRPAEAPKIDVARKNLKAVARIGSRAWERAVKEMELKGETELG